MVAVTRNPSASGEFCRDQKFSQSLTDNLARDVDYSFPATSSSRTLDLGRSIFGFARLGFMANRSTKMALNAS
jgi:hypothetical protein